MNFDPLSIVFGAAVGLSLGLTGGGGAIFAVPLLVSTSYAALYNYALVRGVGR